MRVKAGVAIFLFVSAGVLAFERWANAEADTRTISLYEIHLRETTTVTFKKNGKFIPAAMKKLNYALRDWRTGQPTHISPKLIDLVWSVHKQLGSKKPVYVISGYRSPKTNARLRRRGGGQARRSQHMLGRAMDVHFPDVPIKKIRAAAMVRQQGGVGYYPTSAIPFVHIDVARVRAWPRMSRSQLAMLFPYGRTRHRPASGGPLTLRDQKRARYRLAMLGKKHKSFRGRSAGTRLAHNALPEKRPQSVAKPFALALGMKNSRSFRLPGRMASSRHFGKLWVNKAPGQRYSALPGAHLSSGPAPKPAVKKQAPKPAEKAVFASLSPAWLPQPKQKAPKADVRSEDDAIVSTNTKKSAFSLSSLIDRSLQDNVERPQNKNGRVNPSVALHDPETLAMAAEKVAYSPGFDEEHDDELAYRPFQILPLLSSDSISRDVNIAAMQAPNYTEASLFVEKADRLVPLEFRTAYATRQMSSTSSFEKRSINGMHYAADMR